MCTDFQRRLRVASTALESCLTTLPIAVLLGCSARPYLVSTEIRVGCFYTFSLSLKVILSLQWLMITSRTEL